MDIKAAKTIIKNAIDGFNANKLIRIKGMRSDTCIEIKEKKPKSLSDQLAIDNVHSSCQSAGLVYKNLGIGFDYNANEYTMGYSIEK